MSPRSLLGPFLALVLSSVPATPAAAEPFTKILVDRDGIVRVTDRQLVGAGRSVEPAEVPRLKLTLRGTEVPLRLETLPPGSADGRFAIEFLGAFAHGTKNWEDEYTTTSVYVLSLAPAGTPAPARVVEVPAPGTRATGASEASPYRAHHEVNRLLIRFTGDGPHDESWFWSEVKATDAAPTSIPIAAEAAAAKGPVTLRVRLVGYSHLPQKPDHTVDIGWNGQSVGKAVFDGEAAFTFEATFDAALLREGENQLTLRAKGENTDGIDLVLLDWVELTYPRRNVLGSGGQALVRLADGVPARFAGESAAALRAWSADGTRVLRLRDARGGALLAAPAGEWRVLRSAFPPKDVVVSSPADLAGKGNGADFIIITHPRFSAAAEKLARARRAEGLATVVVPIADVYDRFSHGFLSPEAIRSFLRFAATGWSPRPRYVLLVGDASWDYKNASVEDADYADWHWSPNWARQVPKNQVWTTESEKNDRLFIPTHQYQSPWGHAADDNWFVAPENDPRERPDMAIGRLTVATADEADAIVEKILGYGRLPDGAMKTAVFITNDEPGFQRQTDTLAAAAQQKGYEVVKVYPNKDEKDNTENTKALLRDFDAGPAFVLFNGHGGRYIWRTGPVDFAKNRDLFTLDHLDQLADRKELPVVVSLTCYSAPFDHPLADSIGEKLLRLPHKGAIAVIASSWRNAPPLDLGRNMIQQLGAPDRPRIGDAFLAAKREIADRIAISTYNLLGDPTTPYRGPVTRPTKGDPHAPQVP